MRTFATVAAAAGPPQSKLAKYRLTTSDDWANRQPFTTRHWDYGFTATYSAVRQFHASLRPCFFSCRSGTRHKPQTVLSVLLALKRPNQSVFFIASVFGSEVTFTGSYIAYVGAKTWKCIFADCCAHGTKGRNWLERLKKMAAFFTCRPIIWTLSYNFCLFRRKWYGAFGINDENHKNV